MYMIFKAKERFSHVKAKIVVDISLQRDNFSIKIIILIYVFLKKLKKIEISSSSFCEILCQKGKGKETRNGIYMFTQKDQ